MRGSDMRARAMASICCSPPEKRTRELTVPLPKLGEEGIHALAVLLSPVLQVAIGRRSDLQVLENGQLTEDAAAFRHERETAPDDARRVGALDRSTIETDPSGAARSDAHDGLENRVLPAPLAPRSATISPFATLRLTPLTA